MLQPTAPSPDTAGNRLPFAQLPQPLQPREAENDRAYAAFLLFGMMAAGERSNRLLAKALHVTDSTVRYFRQKFAWERRIVSVPDAEWDALRAYRLLMDLQNGATEAAALRVALDVVLDRAGLSSVRHAVAAQRQGVAAGPAKHDRVPAEKDGTPRSAGEAPGGEEAPGEAAPGEGEGRATAGEREAATTAAFRTPLSDQELQHLDVNRHLRELRAAVVTAHLRPEDVRRQVMLIDGVLGAIARKVAANELEVKVEHIPALLRARALLTGLPTEQVAVAVHHQHSGEVVVESARLRAAREQGGSAVLLAMREEVDELSVILDAVPREDGTFQVPSGVRDVG